MTTETAAIFVTKLGAAQRQLDAAIRMRLAGEDTLAIHTVLAAAYRILRDLKGKRGRSDLTDSLSKGVFYIARDLATGKLKEMPCQIAEHTRLVAIIADLTKRIKAGEKLTPDDVPVSASPGYEARYWREFNWPANFLKHADHDHDGKFSETSVDNDEFIMRASSAYIDLMGKPTPEICVYAAYISKDHSDLDFLPEEAREKLKVVKPEVRAQFCLQILAGLKKA
jgi:hypothetical protein